MNHIHTTVDQTPGLVIKILVPFLFVSSKITDEQIVFSNHGGAFLENESRRRRFVEGIGSGSASFPFFPFLFSFLAAGAPV